MPRRAPETIDLFSDVIVEIRETCQVPIRLTRPTDHELRLMVEASREAETTYSPVGLAAANDAPPGYRLDRWDRALGSGETCSTALAGLCPLAARRLQRAATERHLDAMTGSVR